MIPEERRKADNERYREDVVAAMKALIAAEMNRDKRDGFLIGVRFMVALRKEELAESRIAASKQQIPRTPARELP